MYFVKLVTQKTIYLFVLLITLTSCQSKIMVLPAEVATINKPAISPSGEYTLVVEDTGDSNIPYQKFRILDRDRNVVYQASEQFDIRHTTYFLWDSGNRVWVYSGDVGTFFWENEPETEQWQKHAYARSDVPAPRYLREQKPKWHQR